MLIRPSVIRSDDTEANSVDQTDACKEGEPDIPLRDSTALRNGSSCRNRSAGLLSANCCSWLFRGCSRNVYALLMRHLVGHRQREQLLPDDVPERSKGLPPCLS